MRRGDDGAAPHLHDAELRPPAAARRKRRPHSRPHAQYIACQCVRVPVDRVSVCERTRVCVGEHMQHTTRGKVQVMTRGTEKAKMEDPGGCTRPPALLCFFLTL